jgi:RND family efflux transporter MFP subunit
MRDLTRFRRDAEDLRQRVNLVPSRRASLQAKIAREEANEALAQLDVTRTTVVAPFDGVLQSVDTEIGERVAAGEVVARLVDLSRLEAPLQTPISAGGSVRIGDEVAVSSDNQSRVQWTGRIARISPDADPENRTVAVYVEISQDPEAAQTLLRPGQFIVGRIAAGGVEPRIIVPRRAVDGDRVFVVDDEGNAQPRPVTIEHFLDETRPEIASNESQWAVVSEGLQAGDHVIISNIEDLESGLPVDSSEAASAAASS